jgi:Acetyl-CoA acetyltransferase
MRIIISNAYRLPVGSHGGQLSQFEAYDLFKLVAQLVLERSGIDRKLIDGVIVGNIGQPSDHPNIARKVARELLGDGKWGFVVQRNCASGIQAITTAYEMIKNKDARILLVGG